MRGLYGKLARWIGTGYYLFRIMRRSKRVTPILLWVMGIYIVAWLVYGEAATGILVLVISVGLQLLFAMFFMVIQFVAIFWFMAQSRQTLIRPGDPKTVTFDMYWGQPSLVKMMKEWLFLIKDRGQFIEMGGKPISGILLSGPPGTGKSMLAKAMAGDSGVAFIGCEGCVEVGTRVLTVHGLDRIENIQIGNIIWTGWSWQSVLHVGYRSNPQALCIRTRAGYELVCSPDHPLWSCLHMAEVGLRWNNILAKNGKNVQWVDARNLKVGDRVALCIQAVEFPPGINSDDAYVLGLYIAEGSMTPEYKGRIYTAQIANTDDGLKQWLVSWATSRGYTVGISDTKILLRSGAATWIATHVPHEQHAKDKCIPEVIWCADTISRWSFLAGLFDGDGCVERRYGTLLYHTASKSLARDLQVLLASLGIAATRRGYIAHTTFGNSSMQEISISGRFAEKIFQNCVFLRLIPSKVKSTDNHRARLTFSSDGFVMDVITSIEPTTANMLDLEVQPEHGREPSYCAGAFPSHNSGFRAMF